MRVLQINAVYNISSTGRTSREIQDYINSKTEYICRTAFCNGGKAEDGYIIGDKNDRKLHGALSRIFGTQGYFSTSSTKKLLNYMDEYKPDVVHLRNLHGNYMNCPMLFEYLSEKRIPVVVTLHDCWFFTGKCMHYTQENCMRWQKNCGNCPNLKEGNPSWFFDRTSKMLKDKQNWFSSLPAYSVVGVSDWIMNEAKKSIFGKNANYITRIYNWIDFNTFKPLHTDKREKLGLKKDDFVILSVMHGWEDEYLTRYIELSSYLKPNQKIVMVGDMSKCTLATPENIIKVGLTENVNELVEYYNAADTFLTLSVQETFGKVSAEALSCGTPVICYNSTACPELVGEGCGKVCNVGDLENVAESIAELQCKGKDFYRENCVNFAHLNFDMETNIREYIKIYEKLSEVRYD